LQKSKVTVSATLQAHLGHKINGNKIHESEKSIRFNVIKIDKVLRQTTYTYEGRPPDPIPTVRPFRIRQKMNEPSLPANLTTQKQQAGKGKRILLCLPMCSRPRANCPSAYK
jgi:hypothetical protein